MTPPFIWAQIAAVGFGSAVGALLRWVAALWLNHPNNRLPIGTLLVNCIGGLLIGMLMVWFERMPNELLRLLLVTGFLGGLTTFSTFSGESLALIQRGDWALALIHTLAHTLGALGCAAGGFGIARGLIQRMV